MVDLEFRKELHPYASNMRKFESDYHFTFGDGKKSTPRFCNYEGNPHVYLDEYIISALAKTKKEKRALIDYVKENFKTGWDSPKDAELKRPILKREETVILDVEEKLNDLKV